MNIPDYVSPIIAYRAWQWDASGLTSLNGQWWPPGRLVRAKCKKYNCGVSRSHNVPEMQCRCGIYAAKDLKQLRSIGYAYEGVHGEVYLWGKIVEHDLGWRAQFAYPKSIVLPLEMIPAGVKEAESSLAALLAYGMGIFLEDGNRKSPLWAKEKGYDITVLTQFLQRAAIPKKDDGFRKTRRRQRFSPGPPGGMTPPGGVPPPSLPPPPPVPVHSSWDISRIIQCTHYQWPTQWSLATAAHSLLLWCEP